MYLCMYLFMYLCNEYARRLNRSMALDIDSRHDDTTNLLTHDRPQARIDAPACEFIPLLTRLHFAITELRECVLVVRDTRIRHRMELAHG